MSLQFNATRIEVAGEKRRVEGLGLIFGVGFYSSLKSPDFRYKIEIPISHQAPGRQGWKSREGNIF